MKGLYSFLLTSLVIMTESARILVTAPFPGSHYFAVSDIGHLLAQQGHQVSMVPMRIDYRYQVHHTNYSVVQPFWEVLSKSEFDDIVIECVGAVIESGRDEYMYTETMVGIEKCRRSWRRLYRLIIDYYSSDEFVDFVKKNQFDLIVAEERTIIPILAVTYDRKIPTAVYVPEVEYSKTKEVANLPLLLCSEPSLALQVYHGKKPGFWKRLYAMTNFIIGGVQLKSSIEAMLEPVYKKYGVGSTEELDQRIDLFILNDHPAFSFPYQVVSNVVQVGGSTLKEGKPLDGALKAFVDKQSSPIVLMSMGTYTDLTWLKWHRALLEVLEESNVSVILKINSNTQHKLPALSEKFYTSSWIPQRDLLASGRIKVFVSHCGNNGKIEAIYYKVPILCTPVFAEQSLNGESVAYRGFGEMILPSKITKESFKAILEKMLGNHSFYQNQMAQAVDIYKTEPATGNEKLLYYLNLLLKHRNLDHLVNQIIRQQSSMEIHHLDIIVFLILSIFLALIMVFKVVLSLSTLLSGITNVKRDKTA